MDRLKNLDILLAPGVDSAAAVKISVAKTQLSRVCSLIGPCKPGTLGAQEVLRNESESWSYLSTSKTEQGWLRLGM